MRIITFLISVMMFSVSAFALDGSGEYNPNKKMGKPTMDEMNMSIYVRDSSANAVVLYHGETVEYSYIESGFRITYNIKERIKILNDEGKDYANIAVAYRNKAGDTEDNEVVTDISATSYNLENGKVVKTKMTKKDIFEERNNEFRKTTKFTIPQVRKGTVIEYEYNLISRRYYDIHTWMAQSTIPVMYTEYEVTIPRYFVFYLDTPGLQRLVPQITQVNFPMMIGGSVARGEADRYRFEVYHLPALVKDEYMWCPEDYATQINYELRSIDLPGAFSRHYSTTWRDIYEELKEDKDFGGALKEYNPLVDEMKKNGIAQNGDVKTKMTDIFKFVSDRVKWNGDYTLWSKPPRVTVKQGTGSNTDINCLIYGLIKAVGLTPVPIATNLRTQKRIPPTHPSLKYIDTWVIGVRDGNGNWNVIDASCRDGAVNVLPPTLLTTNAHTIVPSNDEIVNLQALKSDNKVNFNIIASISSEGVVRGKMLGKYSGQDARSLRVKRREAKDSADFVRLYGEDNGFTVEKMTATKLTDVSPDVSVSLEFSQQAMADGDRIYLNPLLIPQFGSQPFKQEKRTFPMEFKTPEHIVIVATLTIPDGYVVEEMPKTIKTMFGNREISMDYLVIQSANTVSVKFDFNLANIFYMPDKYEELKKFWQNITETNKSMLVLKKQ